MGRTNTLLLGANKALLLPSRYIILELHEDYHIRFCSVFLVLTNQAGIRNQEMFLFAFFFLGGGGGGGESNSSVFKTFCNFFLIYSIYTLLTAPNLIPFSLTRC